MRMSKDKEKALFAEWEADYAAGKREDAHPLPRLPSPSEIASETKPGRPEHGDGQAPGPEKAKGRGK